MLRQQLMTIEELQAIPPNPIQRDTRKHMQIFTKPPYGHLSEFHPTHIRMAICETPSGKKSWMLDGHTRLLAVKEGLLDWPKGQKVHVDVWTVKDSDEAAKYYATFDGFSGSKETGTDKIFGAFRYHKFEPHKPHMWRETGLISALSYAVLEKRWGQSKVLTHVQLLEPWMDTIRAIDTFMDPYYNHTFYPGPFTLAQLATVRVYGKDALEWWQKYHDSEMSRTPKSVDGIYKAHELLQEFKNPVMSPISTEGGKRQARGRRIAEITPKVIFCFEQQLQGHRFKITTTKGPGGRTTWKGMLSFPDWWDETIGDRDHPELLEVVLEEDVKNGD